MDAFSYSATTLCKASFRTPTSSHAAGTAAVRVEPKPVEDEVAYRFPFVSIALLLLSSSASAASQAARPTFEQYRTDETYSGPIAPARIATAEERMFRTRLREASRTQKPNFAGRFILATWGCGAECLTAVAIDAKTGRVAWVPFSICCFPENVDEPIQFRLDSSLIMFAGLRNEEGPRHESHFYKFDGKRFVHIVSVPIPKEPAQRQDNPRELREQYEKLLRPKQSQ